MKNLPKELIGASANLIILAVFAKGNSYGYDIVSTVKKLSDGKSNWQYASIYPVLKKLEARGCIKSYWRMEEKQRPRKYYDLTEAGLAELQTQKEAWVLVNDMVTKLLEK
jgi:PadR family transcriptional regulator, regulatory protein PadR